MSVRNEASWKARLQQEFEQPYWESLTSFVRAEYAAYQCCFASRSPKATARAHNGFFGSKPFSRANDYLIANGQTPIQWA